MPAQPSVRAIHIADDQRYVLKPAIVAARIGRRGPALRRQVLGELDELIAETQSGSAQAQPEDALQMLELRTVGFEFGDLLKREDARVKIHRPVQIRDGQADGIDRRYQLRAARRAEGSGEQEEREKRAA